MLMREAGRMGSRSSVVGRLQDWMASSQRTVVVLAKMQMLWCAVGKMGSEDKEEAHGRTKMRSRLSESHHMTRASVKVRLATPHLGFTRTVLAPPVH